MHDVLDARDILSDELAQRRESGYDVEGLEESINDALADHPEKELWRLLELLEDAPRRLQWPYDEPSGLETIRESLPESPQLPALSLGEEDLRDRVRAAWLGRCAGCNLGKPVEGWTREDIRRYPELADEYPIQDYVPRLKPMPEGFEMHPSWRDAVRGNFRFMASDDDIDYTILGLHILETYSFGFGRTIGLAVQVGWDTDCNGATAGSAFGAMHGTEALPGRWVRPLNDLARSMVTGFDNSRLSDLAERTLRFALGSY